MPVGKHIASPDASSSKAFRAGSLYAYITDKAVMFGSRNFEFDSPRAQLAEMISLSTEAIKSKDPIAHYVLAWQEGEQPTREQIEEALDITLEHMGLAGCQVFWGCHDDTKNIHLHIEVNKTDPVTGKVRRVNNGFEVEAIQQAAELVRVRQGWAVTPNGRYTTLENGELVRTADVQQPRPDQGAIDMENRTGQKSAQRIAIEDGGPIIQRATSWAELHSDLAKAGMRYERKGSGALVYVGDIEVKASTVDRSAAFGQLQKRLGAFQPSQEIKAHEYHDTSANFIATQEQDIAAIADRSGHVLRKVSELHVAKLRRQKTGRPRVLQIDARAGGRGPDGLRRDAGREAPGERRLDGRHDGQQAGHLSRPVQQIAGWQQYRDAKATRDAERDAAKLSLAMRQDTQQKALQARLRTERDDIFAGRWTGKGIARNLLAAELKGKQAGARLDLADTHKAERAALRREYPAWPSFEDWQRQRNRPDLAEQYRNRATLPMEMSGPKGAPEQDAKKHDIRDFQSEIIGREIHYSRGEQERSAFIDRGSIVFVHAWRDRDVTLAALQLSAAKWGTFQVTGSDEYKRMCVSLAAEHGLKISNPELQQQINDERTRQREERAAAMKTEQQKNFERYHQAVGADRYRVTSIKVHADGTSKAFVLDKRDGETKGFTPDEMASRAAEIERLEWRGENLYYTPLSADKHHILIDDLSQDKLDAMVKDGYKPAVVIESNPGNYQAVLTIQKGGTVHDKDVANRLTERLNKTYGNAKLSGAIHPHRAPGYTNRKAKHMREDGTYPPVRLLKAEHRECEKAAAMARGIEQEYQRTAEAAKDAQRAVKQAPEVLLKREGQESPDAFSAREHATLAYRVHRDDVVKRQRGEVDQSRVDAMVAHRMKVTGHGQDAIQAAVRAEAPAARQGSDKDAGRDWDDYAKRTAEYAFSAKAAQQEPTLAKYRAPWLDREAVVTKAARQERTREAVQEMVRQNEALAKVQAQEPEQKQQKERGPSLGR